MAETIPNDFILIPNRYLILEDDAGSCMGTIVQSPPSAYGSFPTNFTAKKSEANPVPPEDPPEPGYESVIITVYDHVVFNRESAQGVKIDGTDYLLVYSDNILAFLP